MLTHLKYRCLYSLIKSLYNLQESHEYVQHSRNAHAVDFIINVNVCIVIIFVFKLLGAGDWITFEFFILYARVFKFENSNLQLIKLIFLLFSHGKADKSGTNSKCKVYIEYYSMFLFYVCSKDHLFTKLQFHRKHQQSNL